MAFMPAVLLTAGIAFLSLWENPNLPPSMAASDKLMHGIFYALLAMAWMLPFQSPITNHQSQTTNHKSPITNHQSPIIRSIIICVSVTLYGGVMELLQHYCTTTRSGEWLDLLSDFIGALLGILLVVVITLLRHYVITKKH